MFDVVCLLLNATGVLCDLCYSGKIQHNEAHIIANLFM